MKFAENFQRLACLEIHMNNFCSKEPFIFPNNFRCFKYLAKVFEDLPHNSQIIEKE